MHSPGFVIRTAATMLAALMPGCNAIPDAQAPAAVPPRAQAAPLSIPVPSTVLPERPQARAPRALEAEVSRLVRGFPGKAGAAIRAVDEGWTIESGGMLSMPQQSVSKLWVALTVLDQRDAGRLTLEEPIVLTTADLTLFHQPIAALASKPGGFRTTIGGLLFRALTQSDNTANDKLLWRVGGPAAVREFIARKRLGAIRFGPGERLLQSGTAGLEWKQSLALGRGFEAARARLPESTRQAAFARYVANPVDGAAPLAIADALARLARGELLSETSTRTLLDTMASSITGRARLRAGLAPGWQIAHKTGTGQDLHGRNAGFNDVGLLTAPDGRRYAVAVMIGDTSAPMRVRQELIASVAAALTGGRAAYGASDGAE